MKMKIKLIWIFYYFPKPQSSDVFLCAERCRWLLNILNFKQTATMCTWFDLYGNRVGRSMGHYSIIAFFWFWWRAWLLNYWADMISHEMDASSDDCIRNEAFFLPITKPVIHLLYINAFQERKSEKKTVWLF